MNAPITPFGYAYIGPATTGRAKVDFSQNQWSINTYAKAANSDGTREFPIYVAPQVREMLIDAFLAGIREAVPSRWPELKGQKSKRVNDRAEYYAGTVMGGMWGPLPHPHVPQHICPHCAASPCACHHGGCGSQGG